MLKFCQATRARKKYCLNHKVKYVEKCVKWYRGMDREPEESEVTDIEKLQVKSYKDLYSHVGLNPPEDEELRDISVELWNGNGLRSAVLNITTDIKDFSVFLLPYLRTIKELDISNYSNFSATLFFECVATCQSLQKLSLRGCKQFLQWHFVSYIEKLPKLQYLDLAHCNHFVYSSAFAVMSQLKDLHFIDFVPDNILVEIVEWKSLFINFNKVDFGTSFQIIPQICGINSRESPYAWVDEIEE